MRTSHRGTAELVDDPEPPGVGRIEGNLKDTWRTRLRTRSPRLYSLSD
jgi:hypothetical protein